MSGMDAPPGAVAHARATPFPESVLLEWGSPPPASAAPSKYYIVRLRLDPTGAPRLEKTAFVHASTRTYADAPLAPGRYRYLMGALGLAGSGPASQLEVEVEA